MTQVFELISLVKMELDGLLVVPCSVFCDRRERWQTITTPELRCHSLSVDAAVCRLGSAGMQDGGVDCDREP